MIFGAEMLGAGRFPELPELLELPEPLEPLEPPNPLEFLLDGGLFASQFEFHEPLLGERL